MVMLDSFESQQGMSQKSAETAERRLRGVQGDHSKEHFGRFDHGENKTFY